MCRLGSSGIMTGDCPAHLCSLSISGTCRHSVLPVHSSEPLVREAKMKIAHLRVSTASALKEGG